MFPYILFIICLVFCYLRKSPVGILCLMILFAVLRYDTGWDYQAYVYWILHPGPGNWHEFETSRFSFLWCRLFEFAYKFDAPHIGIIIPNVLTYLFLYFGLDILKLSKSEKVDALIVYCTWYSLYLGTFSTIRQELAMSLGFVAFALLQRKKLYWAIIPFFVAVHLHTSAIVLILLLPIYYLRHTLNVKWLFVAVVIMVLSLMSVAEIISRIEVVDISKYAVYLDFKDNYGGKLIYVNLILALYLIFVFINDKRKSDIDRQCYFWTLVALLGASVRYFLGLSNVLDRILQYFIIYSILILLPSLRCFKEKFLLKQVAVLVLIAYFFVYLVVTDAGSKVASSGFVPYKCILIQ